MAYTTLYLRYRPQKFSELDSSSAREELIKTFKSGKIPHAFLFSGPKGIGKTSAARIVAKAVNCEQHSNIATKQHSDLSYEPCNECSSCISITNQTNMDVLEIDAASNRGIDDIKELRDKIKLAPASSKYKVYIIDEVHMLTAEAFNALLKTLEEPPKHAIFVLCTTDPEKLPKTIVSRCQRINFRKASKKEIVEKLQKICLKEKLDFEEKALEKIAKVSEGSFRDANKILEQISYAGKITEEEVNKTLGVLGGYEIGDFLKMLDMGEIKEALLWINKIAEEGINLKILLENLLEKLRILLLKHYGLVEETEENHNFNIEQIKNLIEIFSRAYFELKNAVIPQLPLEMAVIEWGMNNEQRTMGKKEGEENGNEKKVNSSMVQNSKFIVQINDVLSKWPEILEKIKPLNHSVLAFLKACRPAEINDGFLVLDVFYKFHKDQLETEKCRKIFEKTASEVLGSEVKLRCQLSSDRPPKIEIKTELPQTNIANNPDADIIKMAEEIFNK